MHQCTSIIINSFQLFQRTLFNKGFDVEGETGILKEQMKTNGGGEWSSLSLFSLKVLLKRRRHFLKLFFIYQFINIFIVVIKDIYL